jgi:hypothetical protein
VLALAVTLAAAAEAPYLPREDSQVLQQVPAATDPAVRALAALRTRASASPGDPVAALDLARAYVSHGRRVGDAHYMGYAEAVLAPFLAREPVAGTALVVQAAIVQYRHEFAKARELLVKATAREPRNVDAWLALATLDMVQGNHAAAADGCARVARHGGVAPGLACRANLKLYTGEAEQGVALLATLDGTASTAEQRAWIGGLLAEGNERLGRHDQAEVYFRRGLQDAPGDNFLLVAYADFLLDRGRPADVLALLAAYEDSDTACLRLALAHAALRSREAGRYRWVLAARFAAYVQRGAGYFGREQARFALHLAGEPQAALALAQKNFELQREPADVRILLEAALAAQAPEAAARALDFVARSKLQDPAIATLVTRLSGAR